METYNRATERAWDQTVLLLPNIGECLNPSHSVQFNYSEWIEG